MSLLHCVKNAAQIAQPDDTAYSCQRGTRRNRYSQGGAPRAGHFLTTRSHNYHTERATRGEQRLPPPSPAPFVSGRLGEAPRPVVGRSGPLGRARRPHNAHSDLIRGLMRLRYGGHRSLASRICGGSSAGDFMAVSAFRLRRSW